MKKISAGLVWTDGSRILLGHSTGQPHWDIPKGKLEDGETFREACIRETMEETGIDVSSYPLRDMGKYKYTKRKDLYIFVLKKILPEPSTCKCLTSHVSKGRTFPEFDNYILADINMLAEYVVPHMYSALKKVLSDV